MGEASDNLYVTNLPAGLDDAMVTQFFGIYGTVTSCKVLKNPIATGKTAALVRFASVEEAASILQTLNGTVPTGLTDPVQIKFAAAKGAPKGVGKPPAPPGMAIPAAPGAYGKGGDGGYAAHTVSPYGAVGAAKGNGGHGAEPEISDNIYVQGLPAGTTEQSLQETFMEFGKIKSIKLLASKGPDAPCAALIRYESAETAKLTKEILNGQTPEGFTQPLVVKYARQPGAPGAVPGAVQQWDPSAGMGKGPPPPAPPRRQVEEGGLDCATLVNMIYASDMLPGGRKYFNDRASLYIAGLPNDTQGVHLYKMFSPYGAIHSCNVKQGGGESGHSFAIGFVNYLDPLSAEAAITAYNGMSLPDGNSLKVTIKTSSKGVGK